MSNATNTLNIWQRLASFPGGKWLFSRALRLAREYREWSVISDQ